jgi:hypothetical protein
MAINPHVGDENLKHAIANNCTDPDCEIHHPEVGLEEETIDKTDLAFYLAGMFAGVELAISELDGLGDNTVDEMVNRGLVPRKDLR